MQIKILHFVQNDKHTLPLYKAGFNCGIRPTGLAKPYPLQPRNEAQGGGLRGWVMNNQDWMPPSNPK
jgi:hypothetical protein